MPRARKIFRMDPERVLYIKDGRKIIDKSYVNLSPEEREICVRESRSLNIIVLLVGLGFLVSGLWLFFLAPEEMMSAKPEGGDFTYRQLIVILPILGYFLLGIAYFAFRTDQRLLRTGRYRAGIEMKVTNARVRFVENGLVVIDKRTEDLTPNDRHILKDDLREHTAGGLFWCSLLIYIGLWFLFSASDELASTKVGDYFTWEQVCIILIILGFLLIGLVMYYDRWVKKILKRTSKGTISDYQGTPEIRW